MAAAMASALLRPSSHSLLMAGPSPVYASPVPVVGRLDRADDRQVVGRGEVPVALVLAGHGHDRPGAVGHQHVVGQVDGTGCCVNGLSAYAPVKTPRLSSAPSVDSRSISVSLRTALDERLDLGPPLVGGDLGDQRVLGREHAERHAEAGVGAGGEHAEAAARSGCPRASHDLHLELGALGATDPVALHGHDPLGPVELVEVVEQLLGVVGDLEEPLLEVALLDQVAGALARAVGQDLLVGQHGLAAGAPVHRRLARGRPGPASRSRRKIHCVHWMYVRVVALDLAAPVVDARRCA